MSQILSPLPGTFYIKPSPEAEPYKKPGAPVEVGDVIGLVEVMKTFVEVKSKISGVFSQYRAPDGEPVIAGQILAELVK